MSDQAYQPPDTRALDVKAAMRAYLQRAEVRLSTMHRVAGVFLNGAGLLFLFPVFLKDAFVHVLSYNFFYFPELLPILIAMLGLTLYAYYLLVKDIVNFYFTANHAGIPENYFHPRFILSGIAFSASEDETQEFKNLIVKAEQEEDMRQFVSPLGSSDEKYFSEIFNATSGEIIRDFRAESIPTTANTRVRRNIELLLTAFRLAGVVDRSLAQEVAKMELSLVRHALYLRHLVLRYAKALLLFILTTLVLIILSEVIHMPEPSLAPTTNLVLIIRNCVLVISLVTWAFFVPITVRRPIAWIYQLAAPRLTKLRSDTQLIEFERSVVRISTWVFVYGCAIGGRWITKLIIEIQDVNNIQLYSDKLGIKPGLTLFGLKTLGVVIGLVTGLIFARIWRARISNPAQSVIAPEQPREEKPKITTPPPDEPVRPDDEASPMAHLDKQNSLVWLQQILIDSYSDAELKSLSFKLRIDYEDLPATKTGKAIELIQALQRRNRIPELITVIMEERPEAFK